MQPLTVTAAPVQLLERLLIDRRQSLSGPADLSQRLTPSAPGPASMARFKAGRSLRSGQYESAVLGLLDVDLDPRVVFLFG